MNKLLINLIFLRSAFGYILQTSLGQINGTQRIANSTLQTEYVAFQGIRYANVTTRFAPAVPTGPWQNVYDATQDGPVCYQGEYTPYVQAENCLFLNIYVPGTPNPNRMLPVMIWVHGGSFVNWDATYFSFGPDYFMDENVIIVTLQYRLGVFGFLSTGDSSLPGNYALYDILEALKFLNSYIGEFGGDKNNATIFGQSAGGVLIHFLAQSHQVRGKGYFQKLISESGNNLMPWSLQRKPKTLFNQVATSLQCLKLTENATINCLRKADPTKLQTAQNNIITVYDVVLLQLFNGLAFAPVIETDPVNGIIVDLPFELLSGTSYPTDDVTYFMGFNSEESLYYAQNITLIKTAIVQGLAVPTLLVPNDMNANLTSSLTVSSNINKYYFNNTQPTVLTPDYQILRYITDDMFLRAFRHFFTLYLQKANSYCYGLYYYGLLGGTYPTYPQLDLDAHQVDINYLWLTNTTRLQTYNASDYLNSRRMVRLWANVAKTGNPTPYADPLLQNIIIPMANPDSNGDITCLSIGNDLQQITNPRQDQYAFWLEQYMLYGNPTTTY